jgi:polar amino acid transport system substrate-binding protein/glutamate/aspartate transport system substrate-binding protein
LSFRDSKGQPAGYTVMVCQAVAEEIAAQLSIPPIKIDWQLVTTINRFEAVVDGRIDLLCGAASITLARREFVDFSRPIYVDGAAVLLRSDSTISMFDDLVGQRIGVHAGTTTENVVRRALATTSMPAEVVTFSSHTDARRAIETGSIAAYFGDQSILHELQASSANPAGLTVSRNLLTLEKQGLAMPRGDSDFRLAVDKALSQLYSSGRMIGIFKAAFPGIDPGLALRSLFMLGGDTP